MAKIKRLNFNMILFLIIFLWFIFSFMIFPNIQIMKTIFFDQQTSAGESIQAILKSQRAMQGIKNSFILAITLSVTTTIVGVLEVLFLEYFEIKFRKIINLAYMIPLIFGGVMVANGYIFTYGSKGFITTFLLKIFPNMNPSWFSGYHAVIFLMTFACTSTYMIFFRNSFKSIDYQTVEAARGLGASNFKIIFQIILPTLKPIILTCTVLLFQTGLMAMSAPLMVGGREFETISPLILTFTQRPSSRTLAAILSLFLGIIQLLLLYLLQRNERKGNFLSISKVSTQIKRTKICNPIINIVAHVLAYAFALINLIPFVIVILFSFTDVQAIASRKLQLNSFSLENYKMILTSESAYRPFLTSVFYAAVSSIVVVVLMLVVAHFIYKKRNKFTTILEMIIYTPWVFPGLMFALGLVITYSKPHVIVMNNILTGTLVIMLIAYIIVMMPNTFRFLKASFFAVNSSLEDAAKNLGAKPTYTFIKIVLPIVLPTVLAMLAINFNGKLSEYDLSVFLYNPIAKPIGVVIKNNSSTDAGIEGIALNFVYSVILMTINALIFFFVYADGKNTIKNLFKKKRKITINENQ